MYRRKDAIINTNYGLTAFEYDNFGQLKKQTDSRSKTVEIEYDRAGRKTSVKADGKITNYNYLTSGNNNGRLESLVTENGAAQTYRYDGFGRLVRLADSIPGQISMVTQYTYDSYGRNNCVTYPSGITLTNGFDANNRGYLYQIKNGADTLWQMHSSNNRGQPLRYYLGSQYRDLQVNFSYDSFGKVSEITTGKMKQSFSFDAESGNLMSRAYRNVDSVSGLSEAFEYDNLNRLLSATAEGSDPLEVTYLSNGNINSKSDAGSHYYYNPDKINAVDSVISSPATPGNMSQIIEYNSYNLTTGISGGSAGYTITYNPLNHRIRTVYTPSGIPAVTRYYSGGYEKTDSNGVIKETHYVYSPFGLVALIVKKGETVQTYFVETDHLGSIIGLINPDKTYAERASFDPWGRRRNPFNWCYDDVPISQITDRGFTGHEHLDQFGLINMNGRMYDPVLARFLGVDPVIQSPDFSQSFNGYSYCLNNPLIYTDPSGYFLDAESWQRSMYESNLKQWGYSQVDLWLMESDPNWNDFFSTSYLTCGSAGENFYVNYINLYGEDPEPPNKSELYGYYISVVWDPNTGYVTGDLSGVEISPIPVILQFVAINSLQFPFNGAKIGDRFHINRTSYGEHSGVDFGGNGGEQVRALSSGTVVGFVQYQSQLTSGKNGGVYVQISNNGYITYYSHLREGSTSHLTFGMKIQMGDVIGEVGNTGRCDPYYYYHLHLEVWETGNFNNKFDPLKVYPFLKLKFN